MNSPPVTPQKSSQSSPCSTTILLSPASVPDRKRKYLDVTPAAFAAGRQLLTPPSDDAGRSPPKRRCHDAGNQPYGPPLFGHEAFGYITQLSATTDQGPPQAGADPFCSTHINVTTVPLEDSAIGGCNTEFDEQAFDHLLQPIFDVTTDPLLAGDTATNFDEEPVASSWANDSDAAAAEVCFGMVKLEPFNPTIILPQSSLSKHVHVVNDVQLTHNGVVTLVIGSSVIGQDSIPERTLEILSRLEQQDGVTIQLHCVISQKSDVSNSKRNAPSYQIHTQLFAIIYGPGFAFDSIGDFLDACGPEYCLQDPHGCIRNVPYRNPHRLTGWDNEVPMTVDRAFDVHRDPRDTQSRRVDDWDEVALHKDLPLVPTPSALKSNLYHYQQQALYFMCERERGWNWGNDLWAQESLDGQIVYRNSLTEEDQLEVPAPFRGGLLADQMGLGKTLTIIALVASDLASPQPSPGQHSLLPEVTASNYTKCTLIIVPPNLLTTWDYQLQLHTKQGEMQWSKHHDNSRFAALAELEPYNIVLTTYNTVATEWRNRRQKSLLYSTRWHRIVLDEAHCIREERTQLARAICELQADRRWAVTGTPIQNHLSDLQALLKFLQLDPYNNNQRFVRDIVKCWETDSQLAVERLKRLISYIALRRTSREINIPTRKDLDIVLTLSDEEKASYDSVDRQIRSSRSGISSGESISSRLRGHKVHGLHLLRFICNFGLHTDTSYFRLDDSDDTDSAWNSSDAQKLFKTMVASGMTKCSRCIAEVTAKADQSPDFQPSIFGELLLIAQCGQMLCVNCSRDIQSSGDSGLGWCDCTPACPVLPIPLFEGTSLPDTIATMNNGNLADVPTKTRALVDDILLNPQSKCVVFSAWRTTLDLAERALNAAGVQYTRFDGEVKNPNERAMALQKFRSEPTIRVILITLSCGAVGLDLTVADRAYMMEPQWNPTVEEQALARVHRMGQQNPVTTIRFIIDEAIEKKVVEVQNRKRSFADVLLCASKRRSTAKTPVGTFCRYRSLLK